MRECVVTQSRHLSTHTHKHRPADSHSRMRWSSLVHRRKPSWIVSSLHRNLPKYSQLNSCFCHHSDYIGNSSLGLQGSKQIYPKTWPCGTHPPAAPWRILFWEIMFKVWIPAIPGTAVCMEDVFGILFLPWISRARFWILAEQSAYLHSPPNCSPFRAVE